MFSWNDKIQSRHRDGTQKEVISRVVPIVLWDSEDSKDFAFKEKPLSSEGPSGNFVLN